MSGFESQDDDQSTYRPVSTLAVLALVAGGLSAVALSTQVLWGLPLLAAGLAAAAVRDTAAATPPKAGRGIALIGLALAVGFGCQAVGFAAVQHLVGRSRAIATAQSWRVSVQSGRWAEARDFCTPAALPATGDPFAGGPEQPDHDHDHPHDGTAGDADVADSAAVVAFRAIPAVAAVAGCAAAEVASCRRDDEQGAGSWRVRFELPGCDSAAAANLPAQVDLLLFPEVQQVPRLTPGAAATQRVERWRIIRLEPAE